MDRRSPHRGSMQIILLLLTVAALCLKLCLGQAHVAYSHDSGVLVDNSNWMSAISGNLRLSELSLPGTHNTMALYGGTLGQCQSKTLTEQLTMGIRALDIRGRHVENAFTIHHGLVYQQANLNDVLDTILQFLTNHPTETIFLLFSGDEFYERDTSREWQESLVLEYLTDPNYEPYLYVATTNDNNPTLDQVRGKIFFVSREGGGPYSGNPIFDIQDEYKLDTNWDLYDKWMNVKNQMQQSVSATDRSITYYVNFLSGSGGIFPFIYPYFVASGNEDPDTSALNLSTELDTECCNEDYPDFPRENCDASTLVCTIMFEGTNILFHNSLSGHAGIVFADFPGEGLVNKIIGVNTGSAVAPPDDENETLPSCPGDGILAGNVCCPIQCGTCAGLGCHLRSGGAANCCAKRIQASQRTCTFQNPPCVI